MQVYDVLLIAALVLLTALALRHLLKRRGSCCGDCATCQKRCTQQKGKR